MHAFAPLVAAASDAKSADEAASAFEVIRLSVESGMPLLPPGCVNDLRGALVKAAVRLASRDAACWRAPALEAFERLRDALVERNASERASMERRRDVAHSGAAAAHSRGTGASYGGGAAVAGLDDRVDDPFDSWLSGGAVPWDDVAEEEEEVGSGAALPSHGAAHARAAEVSDDPLSIPLSFWGDDAEESL